VTPTFAHDPSNERNYFVIPGLQHKYRETVLLFIAEQCHSICDWCFRKRLFDGQALEEDRVVDPKAALAYLSSHPEVRSVLLSGGDALLAEPRLLQELLEGIGRIDHIHNVRLGTRALVVKPDQYVSALPRTFPKTLLVPLHIVQPSELTAGLCRVIRSQPRFIFLSQTPLLRGINDNPQVLADLWHRSITAGIQPYYVFQCRPACGNERYTVSLGRGHRLFAGAQRQCTGVVKPARYVMSTSSGKWEIVGEDASGIVLRCHQGVRPEMVGAIRHAPRQAVWWDLRPDDPLLSPRPDGRHPRPGDIPPVSPQPGDSSIW